MIDRQNNSWLQDYHMHTARDIVGKMTEIDACERAVELGFREIAFTNHIRLAHPDKSMSPASFLEHWNKIHGCELVYPSLKIRLGIEMDYYPGREAEIQDVIGTCERLIGRTFDIILGSIHEMREGFFSKKLEAENFFRNRDLLSTYWEYFELETQAVQSGLFDILAHPDLIKKYTWQLTQPVPFDKYKASIEPLISALISNGVGIEINTKGIKLPVNETYPSMNFLHLYLSMVNDAGMDPIITVSSDAHKADDLGYGIQEVIETLRKLDVHAITSFENRKRIPVSI